MISTKVHQKCHLHAPNPTSTFHQLQRGHCYSFLNTTLITFVTQMKSGLLKFIAWNDFYKRNLIEKKKRENKSTFQSADFLHLFMHVLTI